MLISLINLINKKMQKIGQLKLEKPSDVLFEGADTNIYKETKKISPLLEKQFSKIR